MSTHYEIRKLTHRNVGGFRIPYKELVAVRDTRREAEAEAARLSKLMPDVFVVDKIDENGAAATLPTRRLAKRAAA